MANNRTKAHTRYKLNDGSHIPGATTVLGLLNKPQLIPWANRLGLEGVDVKKYVDEKADIGTLAHAMVTDALMSRKTDTSEYPKDIVDRAENCVLSFWAWEKEHPIDAVGFVEKPLVSEEHKFGGTADIYAKVVGRWELLDLKTGKGIYPEHKYQVATYRKLLEENGYVVEGTRILNIPRAETEAFAEHRLSDSEMDGGWKIFLALLQVYYLKRDMGDR